MRAFRPRTKPQPLLLGKIAHGGEGCSMEIARRGFGNHIVRKISRLHYFRYP